MLFVLLAHRTGPRADPLDLILPASAGGPVAVNKLTYARLFAPGGLNSGRASPPSLPPVVAPSAENGKAALDALRLLAAFDAEIPVRRKQAGLVWLPAVAGVDRGRAIVVYAVRAGPLLHRRYRTGTGDCRGNPRRTSQRHPLT